MSQRAALLVTTALTVFVMIVMVGLAWQVFQTSTVNTLALQNTAPAQSTDNPGAAQPVTPPTAQDQLAQRDAAVQQLVQQANQRLEQAYKQQQELSKELATERQNQEAAARAAASQEQPKYKVTPEQAATIALTTEPGAVLIKPAELVDFKGTVAYEVMLNRGLVYIDANTGSVIYDSAAVVVVRDGGGGGGGGGGNASAPRGGGEHESEHEGGGGDD